MDLELVLDLTTSPKSWLPLSRLARKIFRNWRGKLFGNVVFESDCPRKLKKMIAFIAAMNSVKKSSKSEPSSRFFGRSQVK